MKIINPKALKKHLKSYVRGCWKKYPKHFIKMCFTKKGEPELSMLITTKKAHKGQIPLNLIDIRNEQGYNIVLSPMLFDKDGKGVHWLYINIHCRNDGSINTNPYEPFPLAGTMSYPRNPGDIQKMNTIEYKNNQ